MALDCEKLNFKNEIKRAWDISVVDIFGKVLFRKRFRHDLFFYDMTTAVMFAPRDWFSLPAWTEKDQTKLIECLQDSVIIGFALSDDMDVS